MTPRDFTRFALGTTPFLPDDYVTITRQQANELGIEMTSDADYLELTAAELAAICILSLHKCGEIPMSIQQIN